ncbi:MAG: bifunctional (p)ppGpp synthetase/guanosine-3',5'-bis(diphosphate) 3'-pyrophosphohydrolase [Bacilli bacterium]|nr:bifunctional (p)ppGpp synthetase/guanosine-3',5'-bis(diphosphate) 3'-pyrophosphohydrolase [Bacilli bacterium]
MNNITFEDLISLVKAYNPDEVQRVTEAYEFASQAHKGQYRQSGEEYIIHPLNVCYILAQMHADGDTLCAGLLHDVIEDTNVTKEELAAYFNPEVSKLVEGVTKLAKMTNVSKHKLNCTNTRKIITGMMDDVRIVIIKLADRLHNMRTLGYKSSEKQKEIAVETLEVFVPLAYYIGAYRIKNELEDLSLRYINPEEYRRLGELRLSIEEESKELLSELLAKMKILLEQKGIPNEIKYRVKSIFGIYKKNQQGKEIKDIHDLLSLKILVNEVDDCYRTLGAVHQIGKPVVGKFSDYISNPKTNMYQSLHTTIMVPEGGKVQTQIKTFEMDAIAQNGLCHYWDLNAGEARIVMQKHLKEKLQFYRSLKQIDKAFVDDEEFVLQIKSELFADKIYVYTAEGEVIEMPVGATPVDFAYQIHSDVGNHLAKAIVNGSEVPLDYELSNRDRIIVFQDLSVRPQEEWEHFAVTTRARRKMREYNRRN